MKSDWTLYIWTKIALLACIGLFLWADADARIDPNAVSDAPARLRSKFINPAENSLKLNWGTSLTRREVAFFIIFRNDVRIGTSRKTTFRDMNLEPGNYRYKVVAQKTSGRLSKVSQIHSVRVKADYEF